MKDVTYSVDPDLPILKRVQIGIDNGDFGKRTITLETGQLARQAGGAVTAFLDEETMMLATTTASSSPRAGSDFFPLTVDVEERMYAAGRIPGSYFRREGRPSTEAILACRLIDRPLRPTFVKGLRNEVQVVVTVMSMDPKEFYDVVAINAASAATQISGLPVSGPVGGVRMALIADDAHPDGQWVAFPTVDQREQALFEIVVAGRLVTKKGRRGKNTTDVAIMMVEAGATAGMYDKVADGSPAPTEAKVAEGLEAAKPFIKVLCEGQMELAKHAARADVELPVFPPYTDEIYARVKKVASKKIGSLMEIAAKGERDEAIAEYLETLQEKLAEDFPESEDDIANAFQALTKEIVRRRILTDGFRIDGRGVRDIRQLSIEIDLIPRAHGSALFERGETQILGVTTLNMPRMAQRMDSLTTVDSKSYMHHYNFPPYSTGETGRVGSPKRREIGHGALAERAIVPVLPSPEEFTYSIRQVSEALGSNGSTSMGSVCASTMSLLNAGVPLKAPVAGIAMGLVSDEIDGETRYVTLTDILGAEDAFGDMDFKVAGTSEFITALQLDTKLDGIPSSVLIDALGQAREARLIILNYMHQAIDEPDEMSPFAPRIEHIKIPVSKIGEVIGPKGKMIRQLEEETGAEIVIEDDGRIIIGSHDQASTQAAIEKINALANPQMPKVGDRFLGDVVKTTSFGAFVSLLPGRDGLVHISNLGNGERIGSVEDVVNVGDKLRVEIAKIDQRGKISLTVVDD